MEEKIYPYGSIEYWEQEIAHDMTDKEIYAIALRAILNGQENRGYLRDIIIDRMSRLNFNLQFKNEELHKAKLKECENSGS